MNQISSSARAGALATLDGVTKTYGQIEALRSLDLELRAGQVLALLGPNGAGKTTTLNLLLGLARPSRGTVRVFGHAPRSIAARVRLGAMLQISKVPETLRVGEHLELTSSYYPRPLPTHEVLAAARLEGLEKRPFGKLSGGQKQRLLFALAICGDPDLLLLDEPTVGLDVEARRGLWRLIEQRAESGRSVLLTTHHLEEADALADRVLVLNQGSIVADGTPEEIKTQACARQVRCRTRLSAASIAVWPQVERVSSEQGRLQVLTRHAEPVVRRLLELDPDLSDLEVRSAGLEEAMLALTSQDPIRTEEVAA